ncbi:ATP-dependent 6-phosphofructokinase [bacterium]|nr:ATP-dependent 6-phosphofructokinase [bacterium]
MKMEPRDLVVKELGTPEFQSPLCLSNVEGDWVTNYVPNNERILYHISIKHVKEAFQEGRDPASFELAGPRERIFFDPAHGKAGIVTCGGLCPGINDVIRGLVMQLTWRYKVKTIYGFQYGYLGMVKESKIPPLVLDPDMVSDIHEKGGSILGSSRGPQDIGKIVDYLMDYGVKILFCIGGDGTLRGAQAISEEVNKRGLLISVIGIPKTIDNDIGFTEKTFGFETAFTIAVDSIRAAHTEALGAVHGVGLVKLMGRESGYIAANAALASQEVNYCLIPEVPFDLEGAEGLYSHLRERLITRKHAVIVVAEGAGQKYVQQNGTDMSGNKKLGDIGIFLREDIKRFFGSIKVPLNIRYIDPSYLIRSARAIPSDSIYCNQLAQNAVHAGMAGKTGMIVGIYNNRFIHVPIQTAIERRKFIDPEGMFWLNVTESTGQPHRMASKSA